MNASFVHMMLDSVVSARFELLLFAVSVIGYYILHSSRNHVKDFPKKIDVTFEEEKKEEDSQETNEEKEAEQASAHLGRVMDLMQSTDDTCRTTAQMQLSAFFQDFPEYFFDLSDAQAILNFASRCPEADHLMSVSDMLYDRMKQTDEWSFLSMFMNFYLKTQEFEKACDLFELHYDTFFDIELDEEMEWSLIMAALRCKRNALAEHLMQTSQRNVSQQITTIQNWWRRTGATMSEARVERMGDVLSRLSSMFNERYAFDDEERSEGESTCCLGDDSDVDDSSDDGEWDSNY